MTTKQAKRAPVDLPDTTRQWVSNDQAPKPAAFRRGPESHVKESHVTESQRRPVTEIIDIHKDFSAFSGPNVPNIWPKAHLPRLVARLIAAIGTACVLFYLYSELARIAP